MDTYQNRLLQEQFKAELANWQGFDAMYDARLKAFSLYNVMHHRKLKRMLLKLCLFMHLLFRDIAAVSPLSKLKSGKWLSIQQTFAHAATDQGQATGSCCSY